MELDTIVCGDCLDVMADMPDESVDLIVTDPPYGKKFHDGGLAGVPNSKKKNPQPARFSGVKITGDDKPNPVACREMGRVLKAGSAIYLFTQWRVEAVWIRALRKSGFTVRNRLIWSKPFQGAGDLETTYGPQHESILYATKGRHELRGKRLGDVWTEPVGSNGCFRKGKLHPNEKPVDLIQIYIEKSSDLGAIIFDPYIGSGTTAVAALNMGRHFLGCEIEADYVTIANERLAKIRLELAQMELAL